MMAPWHPLFLDVGPDDVLKGLTCGSLIRLPCEAKAHSLVRESYLPNEGLVLMKHEGIALYAGRSMSP